MRKLYILLFTVLFAASSNAQISTYLFNASSGTYTPIAGGTAIFAIGSFWDDNTAVAQNIGFTFTYNGTPYTTFGIDANGYIIMGSGAVSNTYCGPQGGFANMISGFGTDLVPVSAVSGEVRYQTIGSAPNRQLVVQYANVHHFGGPAGDDYSVQIILNETSNSIQVVFGSFSAVSTMGPNACADASTESPGIGLLGATSADFNLRSVTNGTNTWATATAGAALSAVCNLSPANIPASGLTWTWAPAPPCVAPANQPTGLVLTAFSASQINGSFTAAVGAPDDYLVVRYPTGAAPTSPVNGTTYVAGNTLGTGKVVAASASTSFNATGLSPVTTYDFYIYSYNSLCTGGPLYRTVSALFGTQTTQSCGGLAAGTYTVGPTGTYPTLTAAITATNAGTTGPVIFELQSTYTSVGETFPITFLGNICPSNITIRPAAGAVALSITSANATGTINFNGGSNVTIDGRAGGVGVSQLTLSNTSLTGYTVQYINSAVSNTIKYCTVTGVNTGAASGVIFFNNAVGLTTGNSNNTIDNCDIHDGATTPTNLIYVSGNTTDYASQNNNDIISNSNIHDWFNASSTTLSAAINIVGGASDWTITGNSFYQSVPRIFTMVTATDEGAIFVTSATFGTNFTITNNFIGGTAPLCGGGAWTYTGGATGTPTARMIRLTAAVGPFSNISGNTLTNIAITSSTTNNLGGLISHVSGNVNINNNTLGSQTTTGAVTFTLANASVGIFYLPIGFGLGAVPCTINITNNNIGSITATTSSTGSVSFRIVYGQPVAGSIINISNNLIGGTAANSIQQLTNNLCHGILILNPTIGNVISNNTVRNITQNNVGVTGSVVGINVQSSGGGHTITGNTVFNLTTNGTNVAINNAASVVGISMTGLTVGGGNISGNTVYNLTNTNATVAGWINGMYFATAAAPQPTTIITKNFVHSINLSSAIAGSGMAGIFFPNTGNGLIYNNMVRLGIDASGASITTPLQINGIYKVSSVNTGVYFNTVYIGGTGVASGTVNTYAYRRGTSGTADTVLNNIFYNSRSNASGTGKHYAINLNASTAIVSNNNDLYVDGTGGVLGVNGVTDYATLAAWRTGTVLDGSSVSSDPKLLTPTGTSATVDLHINPASPTAVEQGGVNLPQVTDDFDGQARAGLTPVDIGADAGNFILLDQSPPVITYAPLSFTCNTGDRVVSGVTITDATGVPIAGALRPRIYYKKNVGAYFSQPGTLSSGTGTNGTWSFTIVAADMGGLATGDVVSYFIIAQDIVGPYIASNPAGVVATDVNTVTTPPAVPNTYSVTASVVSSGTYNVGVGQTFTTLTAAVAAYNSGCLTGPVVFQLTDASYSASETFPITITANPFSSAINTLTIKPTLAGTTITGSSATGLIVLNGADWVTINGSISATANTICPASAASRDLTITNTNASTTSAVIWLQTNPANILDAATNNKIINLNLVGSGNLQTLIGVGSGSSAISTASLGTGNNNNSYINNNISKTQYGVFSQGANLANKNTGTVINQNLINTVAPNNVGKGGVVVGFENNISISGNTISEIAYTTAPDVFGIAAGGISISSAGFTGNEVTNAVISKNNIGSVRNTGTFSACGIYVTQCLSGTNQISDNMISGVSANATSGDISVGMLIGGGNGTTQIYYNTITMTSVPANPGASDKSYALAIGGSNPVVDVRNNIFFNTQNNGSGNDYAVVYGYTPFTNLTSDHNDYFVSAGATFFVGGTGSLSAPTNQLTLANLQAATGKDGSAQNVLPTFVSATDLHLNNAGGVNWCLNGTGVSIGAITDDIDCQVRSNPSDIGADEFNVTGFVINNPAAACAPATVDLTAAAVTAGSIGGLTFTYYTDAAGTIVLASPNAVAVSGTYYIKATNGTGTLILPVVVTVNPQPTISGTLVQPTTCVTTDGSITLTIGGTAGPFTFAWTGTGVNPTSQNQTNLTVGSYNVTVTNVPTGCSNAAVFVLTGPGGCNICPTIPSVTTNPAPAACLGSNVTLTAPGLINMGITYGITFKYSLVPLVDPYAAGTVIATVPNGSLTGGGTSATTNTSFAASGNYIIYAILSPVPVNPACRPFAQVNLTVNPIPTVNPVSDQILCNGSSTTAVTFSGGVPGTVFNWTNNNASIGLAASGTGNIGSFIATNPGVSPVTSTIVVTPSYTNAGGTCFGPSTTFFITVNPSPTVTISGGGVNVCPGTTVNLTTTATPGVTYSWTRSLIPGGPSTPAGNTSGISVTQSGIYTVTVLAGTGCTGTASTYVNVGDYIFNGSITNADASQTDRITRDGIGSTCASPKACPGSLVIGAIHYDTYTITNPSSSAVCATIGLISGCGTNIFTSAYLGSYIPGSFCTNYLGDAGVSGANTYYEVTIPANGTVVIVVNEVVSGAGCGNYTLSVNVPRTPAGITTVPGTTICSGTPVTLTASAANTYLWNPGGATTQSIIVSPVANTTYSVTLGYGNTGCTASASQLITVNQVPVVSTPANVTICSGLNTSFSVTATGAGPFTYQWQINQGAGFINLNNVSPFSNTTTATLNITAVTTAYSGNTFRCIVTGACGSTTSNAATLTVNQTPTITVGPSGLCAPVVLTAQGTSNTYSWSPALGLSATTGAVVTASPGATTIYTVTGTVTATGCTNTATATVLGNSSAAVLTGTATICAGSTANLVVNITGGVSPYTVVYSNGVTNTTVPGYVSGTNIPVSPAVTTTYTLVSVTGSNGCAGTGNSGSAVVTVNPVPTISVGPNNQCGPVVLTATGTSNTYSWSPAAGLSATTGATVTANPAVTTLYTVTGTITATGCTSTATVTVFATPTAPVISPSSISICAGSITQLTATATPAAVWSPVAGLFTDPSATIPYVAGTQLNIVYAKPAATTTYTATSTLGSCSSSTNVTVTVFNPIVITTQPVSQTVCQGANVTFSVVITGNFQSYQWQVSTNAGVTFTNIAGANNSSLVLPAVAVTLNNNQYRVVITNSCNTVTSSAAILTVNPLPVVTITAANLQNRICLTDSLISLAGLGSPTGGSWTGIGVSGFNFIPGATAVGTYILTYTYTTNLGCTASASTPVVVQDCQERLRLLRDNAIILYPNPNTGRFNIRINSTLYGYLGMKVFTYDGQLVRTQNFAGLVYGRVIAIDMTNLPPEVYMVKFYYDAGNETSNKTFKVIIGSH